MRIAIVRRAPNTSFSMDVYANGIVSGLRAVRPNWEIVEIQPKIAERKRLGTIEKLFGKASKYYEQYWRYPQVVKACDADVVHIIDHSDGHLAYWLKGSSAATVITCHDLINFFQPENASHQALLPGVSSALWRYSVRGLTAANQVVAVSAHTAKDIRTLFDIAPAHITIAHNGVEDVFRAVPTAAFEPLYAQYKIERDRFYLLNVGSSQPRKNIETVLKALALLVQEKNELAPVHLIKAGAAFTAEQTDFIKREGLQPYITHVQKPDKATLVKLYSLADTLVAPSLYEGFGITILEAMACGTPVITANVSALPEVAGSAAILIDPEDVKALAGGVRSLQTDPSQQASLICKGQLQAASFTWEKSAERVAEVYENLRAR